MIAPQRKFYPNEETKVWIFIERLYVALFLPHLVLAVEPLDDVGDAEIRGDYYVLVVRAGGAQGLAA